MSYDGRVFALLAERRRLRKQIAAAVEVLKRGQDLGARGAGGAAAGHISDAFRLLGLTDYGEPRPRS